MIRVVNIKNENYDIYGGRPGKFGNPFIVGIHGKIGECIHLFREWFYSNDSHVVNMRRDVLNIPNGSRIGCYCKPLHCHCDIIIEYYNSNIMENL